MYMSEQLIKNKNSTTIFGDINNDSTIIKLFNLRVKNKLKKGN